MKQNMLRKIAIQGLSALVLISTLMSKKAVAHITDDESSVDKHSCTYYIPNPGEVTIGCGGFGNMCVTRYDCHL